MGFKKAKIEWFQDSETQGKKLYDKNPEMSTLICENLQIQPFTQKSSSRPPQISA